MHRQAAEAEDDGIEIRIQEEKLDFGGGSMSRLPRDIIIDILSRLPVKTLKGCIWVCKSWYHIVHYSTRFKKLHFDTASKRGNPSLIINDTGSTAETYIPRGFCILELDHGKSRIEYVALDDGFTALNFQSKFRHHTVLGSCNGLLLLADSSNWVLDSVYVINPLIGEYVTLPPAPKDTYGEIFYGFGFDFVDNAYKIIRMCDSFDESFDAAEVYTIGTGSWRHLGNVKLLKDRHPQGHFSHANVNGTLHWINNNDKLLGFDNIICLGIHEETIGVLMPPPVSQEDERHGWVDVVSMEDQLYFLRYNSNHQLVMWSMKEYGVKESWIKQYIVDQPLDVFFHPICFLKNGDILFSCFPSSLLRYNPKKRRFQTLQSMLFSTIFSATPHVASLMSQMQAQSMTRGCTDQIEHGCWSKALPVVSRAESSSSSGVDNMELKITDT